MTSVEQKELSRLRILNWDTYRGGWLLEMVGG